MCLLRNSLTRNHAFPAWPTDHGPGQGGTFTGLLSKVTEPVRASALPLRVAPVSSEMDACAIMIPANVVVVPRVAELPTCQNTFSGNAPPLRTTSLLFAAVVRVETIWKM